MRPAAAGGRRGSGLNVFITFARRRKEDVSRPRLSYTLRCHTRGTQMRFRATVFASALLCLVVAAPAWAQFDTGAVLGTIRDSSGGVLPGVTVTLLNVATGISATKVTDEHGAYEFFTVRVGTYTVKADLSGFTAREIPNVKVDVGARQRVDVMLGVGPVAETISVIGTSPLIETDSSQRGQVITGDQTRALPLNGREYSALA